MDWWTLGAVLYEMLYGLPPFYSRETSVMYDAILNKPLKLKPTATQRARVLLQGVSVAAGRGNGDREMGDRYKDDDYDGGHERCMDVWRHS